MTSIMGRPTKYDPSYCEMLITHMEKGYSFESFAAVINVHRETLYAWASTLPEFSDAKKMAFDKNLYFWERMGLTGLMEDKEGLKLNSSVWIFNMKSRHKWRDRHETEMPTASQPQVIITLPDNGRSAPEGSNE